jgi:hypothetical protein
MKQEISTCQKNKKGSTTAKGGSVRDCVNYECGF